MTERFVHIEETREFQDKVKAARARLDEAGVKYVFASWVDFFGRTKSKAFPLERFDQVVRGSGLYTVGALEGMGPLGPNEDECAVIPDLDSLAILPWNKRYAWMVGDLWWHGERYAYDPRWILQQQLEQAAQAGYSLNLGFEAEFYVLKDEGGTLRPLHPNDKGECWGYDVESTLDGMPFLDRVATYAADLGWDLQDFDHEGGHSQYEINFTFIEGLRACDRLAFYRLMLKEVAKQFGAFATFMPKPLADDFGSACNYNMSLADAKTGANVFDDPNDPRGLGYSETAYHYVGGMLKHAQAITAVTAPTVNSYKRLVGQGYMPMITWAGVHLGYGQNNRTCMFRLPGNRRCVESRASDIASNMYLGAAMFLAGGLEGIKEEIDPGDPVTEDMYKLTRDQVIERGLRQLPRTLLEAVEAFEADPLSDQVFGPLKKVFVEVKHKEWEEYHNLVSDWEREKYLNLF